MKQIRLWYWRIRYYFFPPKNDLSTVEELRIWNRCLTKEEIEEDYKRSK